MTDDTTDTFGANLVTLAVVAYQEIPAIAGAYGQARLTAASASGDSGVFPPASQLRPAWQGLRQRLERILTDTQHNTQATATALIATINHYTATDDGAAAELGAAVTEHNRTAGRHDDDGILPLGAPTDGGYPPPRFSPDGRLENPPA